MAELFRHTDEDGETLRVVGVDDLEGRPVIFCIDAEQVGIFVDRDAALRLAAALVSFYSSKDLTKEEADAEG